MRRNNLSYDSAAFMFLALWVVFFNHFTTSYGYACGKNFSHQVLPGSSADLLPLYYESAFLGSSEAIVVMNLSGKIIRTNQAVEALFQWSPGALIGQEIEVLMPERYRANHVEFRGRYLSKPCFQHMAVRHYSEIYGISKTGEEIPLSISLSPFRMMHSGLGEVVILAAIKDLSLKKKYEQLLAERDDIRKREQMSSLFFANMTHELRSPMNGLLGAEQLLRESPLTDQQKEYLRIISASGEGLRAVVEDILDSAQLAAGALKADEVRFSPQGILSQVKQVFSSRILEKGILFDIQIEDSLPQVMIGDSKKITRVLFNFLNNAIKFTNQGVITLKGSLVQSSQGDVIRFLVQDTGVGIHPDTLKKLFSPFHQADPAIARKYGGTGLGLFISKQFLELMNASLIVETEVGVGSKFGFDLPIVLPAGTSDFQSRRVSLLDDDGRGRCPFAGSDFKDFSTNPELKSGVNECRDEAFTSPLCPEGVYPALKRLGSRSLMGNDEEDSMVLSQERTVSSGLSRNKKLKILIVDDMEINLKILSSMLVKLSCDKKNIATALSGRDAIELQRSNHYDIVFMDYQMPELDGIQTVQEMLREHESQMAQSSGVVEFPVVVMSSAGHEVLMKFLKAMDNPQLTSLLQFMPKPIQLNELKKFLDGVRG